MSDLMKQAIRLVRIDGVLQHMSMNAFEAETKKPNVRVYEDRGVLCLDHVKVVEAVPTPVIEELPPPPPLEEPTKIVHDENYTGHRPKNLHYHYKAGKQTQLIPWAEIEQKIKDAYLDLEPRVYFIVTMFTGARKNEVLELTVDNITYDDTTVYVNYVKRLKGSETTDPIPISRTNPFADDIITLHNQRSAMKPTKKLIIRFGKIYTGIKKGKDRVPVWSKTEKIDKWMFLNISGSTATNIFKAVLGPAYYAHYGRLWFLSTIGTDPKGNIVMLKSMSGIRSTHVLNSYMGQSKAELKKGAQILTDIVTQKTPNIPATAEEPKTSS